VREIYALPLPSDETRKRVTMTVPVRELLNVLRQLDAARGHGVVVDHIYDY
jgi:hypothetical protein